MSGSMPIASEVEQELGMQETESERSKRAHLASAPYPEHHSHAGKAQLTSSDDFLSDLLDAQQRLISAQHQYLHDSDMQALARAQLDVISVQNSVLGRLGVFG